MWIPLSRGYVKNKLLFVYNNFEAVSYANEDVSAEHSIFFNAPQNLNGSHPVSYWVS